jgi:N,N'-diacetyllegionaminate synthase
MINNKPKIIAEIGWNHLGNIKLAEKFIESAAKSGADFCKFQTWSPKYLKPGKWDFDGRRKIYEKATLSYDDHIKLKKICIKNKVKFITSIFNSNDLNFLSKLEKRFIKIPSHEVYNLDLITKCLKKFDKVFISVGAAKWSEITNITKLKNFKNKAVLMHCVSSYPCHFENLNFPKLEKLRKLTKNIGYSGHHSTIDDAILAISKGASIVEKHFTINPKLKGRDNKFAITPIMLTRLVDYRDNFYNMMKPKGLNVQGCEMDIFKNYRGRWSK